MKKVNSMATILSDFTTFSTETEFNNETVITNSPDPSTPVDLFDGYSTAILHFAAVSCILFIVLGVPGNLITIIALARCKKVRNATAVFIINLSLSDLLFCCFNLPLAASTFLNRAWTHGDLLCRLFPLLRYGLLAVSLFTILAITINRYVMIGHPRIYPRIYQRKFLIVMVATCWICAFLPLIFTWTGQWGQFGLDTQIGSCSILPDKKGHSPKEFLFIIAFALPCLCILICYARIFYIVRKTHESVLKSAGSVKIIQPSVSNASEGKKMSNDGSGGSNFYIHNGTHEQLLPAEKRRQSHTEYSETSSSDDTSKQRFNRDDNSTSKPESVDKCSVQTALSSRTGSLYQRQRHYLKKLNDNEDLKFIDSSVESDLPPTLSNLRTNVPRKVHSQLSVTINETRNGDMKRHRNNNNNNMEDSDSAVEHSSSSMDQNQAERGDEGNSSQHLTIPIDMDPSSSSGIDIPPEPENKFQRSKKRSFVSTLRKSTRLTGRNRSLANTSGASIMYPGRMTPKDRRLLKMILVLFGSFVICYLPITINKIFEPVARNHFMNIIGYVLIYLTTCINPIIYVVMSSEYRQAYKNLLMCRNSNLKPTRMETQRAASPKE